MAVSYVTKDQVAVPPITPVPTSQGGALTAGASYGVNEQSMLQTAYNTHRATGNLK